MKMNPINNPRVNINISIIQEYIERGARQQEGRPGQEYVLLSLSFINQSQRKTTSELTINFSLDSFALVSVFVRLERDIDIENLKINM